MTWFMVACALFQWRIWTCDETYVRSGWAHAPRLRGRQGIFSTTSRPVGDFLVQLCFGQLEAQRGYWGRTDSQRCVAARCRHTTWGAPVLVTDDFPPGSPSDLPATPLCGRILFGTKMAANRAQVRF